MKFSQVLDSSEFFWDGERTIGENYEGKTRSYEMTELESEHMRRAYEVLMKKKNSPVALARFIYCAMTANPSIAGIYDFTYVSYYTYRLNYRAFETRVDAERFVSTHKDAEIERLDRDHVIVGFHDEKNSDGSYSAEFVGEA